MRQNLAGNGSGGDAASQALNAVAGIFKQEMNDLIEANPNVIVVATTNFPHRVDESLIRSGRFDVKISVPKPDEASRTEIFARTTGISVLLASATEVAMTSRMGSPLIPDLSCCMVRRATLTHPDA